jgi:Mce-associated membrane protein
MKVQANTSAVDKRGSVGDGDPIGSVDDPSAKSIADDEQSLPPEVGAPDTAAAGDSEHGDEPEGAAEATGHRHGSSDEPAARRGRASRVRRGAAVVLIATMAVTCWEAWLLIQQHQNADAAHQALPAATTFANALITVDANAVDKDFDDVLDGSTGGFKDLYNKSSTELRQLIVENKAAAHGTVVDAAVESGTKDKVVVLLFIDQSVKNQATPDPQIDRSRVRMTMEKVNGRWLASKVEMP